MTRISHRSWSPRTKQSEMAPGYWLLIWFHDTDESSSCGTRGAPAAEAVYRSLDRPGNHAAVVWAAAPGHAPEILRGASS